MEITINISMGTKEYEFYNVPEKVGKAIITLLYECENDNSNICSAESERWKMGIIIFRVCLIIADAICIATTDSKISKILGVLAIIVLSISFLGR